MTRRVFYSFHYKPDNWRAAQVRNMGVIEGNPPCSDNDWESIKKGSDAAIKKWISDQMSGKSCIVVLIGSDTTGRKWINHEIIKGWNDGKGVVGIYIHNLKNCMHSFVFTMQCLLLNWFWAEGRFSSGVVEGLDNKAKLTTGKAYGFRTYRGIEIALYHALGDLPVPKTTYEFFEEAKKRNLEQHSMPLNLRASCEKRQT